MASSFDFGSMPSGFDAGAGFSGGGIDLGAGFGNTFGIDLGAGGAFDISGPAKAVEPDFWGSFGSSTQLAQAGIGLIGDYFKGEVAGYQAQAQQAAKQTQYWTQLAHTNRENYRNYDRQLRSYYRAATYTEEMRQYESKREAQQATYKGDVATAASENFVRKIADLDGQFYEQEAADNLELDEMRLKATVESARKSGAARGQAGRTINAMAGQYNQQYLANLSNRQITREWRIADKVRAAQSLEAARKNTINQVQLYTPQPQADPVKPLAPIKVEGYAPPDAPKRSTSLFALNAVGKVANAAIDYRASLQPQPQEQ